MMRRRTAIVTGCGVVSPLGCRVAEFWSALVAGRSALAPIRSFDTGGAACAVAAEVADFRPEEHLSAAEVARLDRVSQFSVAAARQAIGQARLDLQRVDRTRIGVILATTLGGIPIGEAYQRARAAGTPFPARQLLQVPYYAVAARLARTLGVRGPVVSPSIACASGTHAVGLALEFIRAGHADGFIVGGVEALSPFVVHGFNCLRATTADTVRPFDARRRGLLLGEGAAVLVVENADHAAARGVDSVVEVAGSGLAGDAAHITAPARDGAGAARAMRAALADAGVEPAAVDFISAHGTGTPYNDAMEVAAIASVFGEAAPRIPVNSIKGAIGHTLGAAGSFEAIMAAQVLRESVIPPTVNCEVLDPACPLDVVRGAARRRDVRTVLSTSSAFAGNNAAIVLRRRELAGQGQGEAGGERRPKGAVGASVRSVTFHPKAETELIDIQVGAPHAARMSGEADVVDRTVITGIGLVTPFGSSRRDLAARFAQRDCTLPEGAGRAWLEVARIPAEAVPEDRRARLGRMDRLSQFLMTASYLAVEDAGLALGDEDPERIGLSFGTGLGCLLTDAEYNQAIVQGGTGAASPRLFAYTVSSAAAGEVSIALGVKGPNLTVHLGLAAGLGAIGYGADLIEVGKADVVLAAGADVIGPPIIQALRDMDLLKDCAETAPFRGARPGIFPAEAAVVLVLEGERRARERGRRMLGRIEGYAAGFEPTLTREERETAGVTATIRRALERSGRRPAEAAAVFTSAHGTALDDTERMAIGEAFGPDAAPLLMAPKTLTGEVFGASGVLALALAAEVLAGQSDGADSADVADGVTFDLRGVPQPGLEASRRLAAAPAVLIDALCYTGNVVALVLGRATA